MCDGNLHAKGAHKHFSLWDGMYLRSSGCEVCAPSTMHTCATESEGPGGGFEVNICTPADSRVCNVVFALSVHIGGFVLWCLYMPQSMCFTFARYVHARSNPQFEVHCTQERQTLRLSFLRVDVSRKREHNDTRNRHITCVCCVCCTAQTADRSAGFYPVPQPVSWVAYPCHHFVC